MTDAFPGTFSLNTQTAGWLFCSSAAETYLKIDLRVVLLQTAAIIHERQLRNVSHMSVSERLYYVTTSGCLFFFFLVTFFF